jgi:hypothetical protein
MCFHVRSSSIAEPWFSSDHPTHVHYPAVSPDTGTSRLEITLGAICPSLSLAGA